VRDSPSPSSASHLRLVGARTGVAHDERLARQQAELAVIKENRIAAHATGVTPGIESQIDPRDPRWVLAMQTQARLQGAVLPPEKRDELMRSGRKLGLRPFESNLVIAIVQDRARSGRRARDAAPALALVHPPQDRLERNGSEVTWPKWFAALAGAAAVATLLMRWIGG
jgi:hypothetical protein